MRIPSINIDVHVNFHIWATNYTSLKFDISFCVHVGSMVSEGRIRVVKGSNPNKWNWASDHIPLGMRTGINNVRAMCGVGCAQAMR